jgi:hypothetical protein
VRFEWIEGQLEENLKQNSLKLYIHYIIHVYDILTRLALGFHIYMYMYLLPSLDIQMLTDFIIDGW